MDTTRLLIFLFLFAREGFDFFLFQSRLRLSLTGIFFSGFVY